MVEYNVEELLKGCPVEFIIWLKKKIDAEINKRNLNL